MYVMQDQLKRNVSLINYPPKRIVSLVPSQTELLHYLGLEDEVVGITKFCVHPTEWFHYKTRVGGTKNVNIEKVASLQPDLIIANKEENVKEQIEQLEKIAPVWISDVNTLDEALSMIQSIGEVTNKQEKAFQLADNVRKSFSTLQTNLNINVCYLIWKDPYMSIGNDTFINDLLKCCGLHNVFENEERYPTVTIEQIKEKKPEYILLSSEPFPFKQKHIDEINTLIPNAKVLLVDGEMFSWYGSRLLFSAAYFKELINKLSTDV